MKNDLTTLEYSVLKALESREIDGEAPIEDYALSTPELEATDNLINKGYVKVGGNTGPHETYNITKAGINKLKEIEKG